MGINRIPASVVQYTQYYPSGLPWESNSGDNPGLQHKKYNGKEFIEMNGLNALDYGARLMFPDRGPVFSGVDPLCEKYYSISPYAYCAGNPVKFTDPSGMYVVGIDGKPVTYDIKNGWSLTLLLMFKKLAMQ